MKIGIINRASEASEKTEDANDLEYLRTEAYGELIGYYSSGSNLSEQDYVLQKLGEKEGITVNQTAGTVTYNGKTYNISKLLGNSNEQNSLANNGLTQVTDSPLITENSNIRMVLQETTASGALQAVIPAGFYYVTGKPSTGLVISDVQGDDDQNTKGGNQFVWVPCDGEQLIYEAEKGLATTWREKYSGMEWYYTTVPEDSSTATDPNAGETITDWTDDGGNETSVEKYGGFYVARFEAGVPNDANFYADSNGATYTTDDSKGSNDVLNLKPVSKKNNQAWNYISQEKAVTVSANMYTNSSSVTSSLIDSYAWDTIVEWMTKEEAYASIGTNSINVGNYLDNTTITADTLYALHLYRSGKSSSYTSAWTSASKYKKGNITSGRIQLTEETKGQYEFTDDKYSLGFENYIYYIYKELATGASDVTKIKNIYDMAGNMWEWTTETGKHGTALGSSDNTFAVFRGGSFSGNGSSYPVSYRDGGYTAGDYVRSVGFRVVLYIK